MKKILMGLLTLSVASLAAFDVDAPDNETLVFYGDQTGKIAVNMGIKSDAPTVKYVVYSKVGGAATNISELTAENEVVKLPDFTISTQAGADFGKYGFSRQQTPTIYVQKVGNGGALTDLATRGNGEDLYVKWIPSSDWGSEFVTSGAADWSTNDYWTLSPFQFMTKAALDTLIQPIGGTVVVVKDSGFPSSQLGIQVNGKNYRSIMAVKYEYSRKNGEISFESWRYNENDHDSPMTTPEEAAVVERLFSKVQQGNGAAFGVRVGAGS